MSWARLEPLLERVPITRVYAADRLDWLGLPVWAAVTPLACDLTVHAGKGSTAAAARIGAVMEAIERVCAESVDPRRVRIGAYAGAGDELDPESLDLPFETVYRPGRPISWVHGEDLLAGGRAWVPLDAVISPPREGVCSGVDTNGLAAGFDRDAAVVHALCELIERDALALDRFARRYADELPTIRVLDREALPPPAAGWVAALRARGVRVVVTDLTSDLGLPVLRATLYDTGFPGREGRATTFEGLGADPDPVTATCAALLEAVQGHTGTVVGARDTIEEGVSDGRSFFERAATPTELVGLPEPLARRGIEELLDRLHEAGFERCVVVDLDREDIGIPVVRVVVPGLAGPYGVTTRRPADRLLRMLA